MIASADVLTMRHRFEMRWLGAQTDAAEVVDFQTGWDRPLHVLVGAAVCHDAATDLPVPVSAYVPEPQAATVGVRLTEFRPKREFIHAVSIPHRLVAA